MAALQAERRGKLGYRQVKTIVATLYSEGNSPEATCLARQLWAYLLAHSELKDPQIIAIVESSIPPRHQRTFMSTAQRLREEGREEGHQEGRDEGQWIGKIELLEQMLGKKPTARKALESDTTPALKARFEKLEKEYRARFR